MSKTRSPSVVHLTRHRFSNKGFYKISMLSTSIVPWASLFVDTDIIVEQNARTLRIGIGLRAHTQRQMLDPG